MAWTFVGVSWMPATDNANAASAGPETVTPPTGMQSGDHVVLYVANDQLSPENFAISTTGGQTWTAEAESGSLNSSTSRLFHCIFNGTWDADPQVDWDTSAPYGIAMVVFRGGDGTTLVDQGPVTEGYAAPTTPFDVTIASGKLTSVSAGAMVVAFYYSNDNNTWALQTAGWANPGSQTQWRNAGGSDCSISVGYKEQASAGNSEAVTNRQTAVGGDSGQWTIIALKPAAGGPTIVEADGAASGVASSAVDGRSVFSGVTAAVGVAAAAVAGAAFWLAVATAPGVAAGDAPSATVLEGGGGAAGAAVASATSATMLPGVASSAGVGTASAEGADGASGGQGVASGTAIVAGVGASTAASSAGAAGVATAQADGANEGGSDATAAGTATATAASAATAQSEAAAAGTCSVAGASDSPPSATSGWGDPRIAKLLAKGMKQRPKKRPRREEPVPVYTLPDDDPDWEAIVLALLTESR